MRLLIDTHALIWFCEGSERLGKRARAAMENERNERLVSHAVPWEMAIKMSLGKLTLSAPFDTIFPSVLDDNGFELLPLGLNHFSGLIDLPGITGNPFDRLMISQAQSDGLTIVTCDPHFRAHGLPLL